MDFLQEILPKVLVNIVEEYAKDRTKYDAVIDELERRLIDSIWITGCQRQRKFYRNTHKLNGHGDYGPGPCCCRTGREGHVNYKKLKSYPSCLKIHMKFLNNIMRSRRHWRHFKETMFSFLENGLDELNL